MKAFPEVQKELPPHLDVLHTGELSNGAVSAGTKTSTDNHLFSRASSQMCHYHWKSLGMKHWRSSVGRIATPKIQSQQVKALKKQNVLSDSAKMTNMQATVK